MSDDLVWRIRRSHAKSSSNMSTAAPKRSGVLRTIELRPEGRSPMRREPLSYASHSQPPRGPGGPDYGNLFGAARWLRIFAGVFTAVGFLHLIGSLVALGILIAGMADRGSRAIDWDSALVPCAEILGAALVACLFFALSAFLRLQAGIGEAVRDIANQRLHTPGEE